MKKSVATMFVAAGFASMIALGGGVASADQNGGRPAQGQEDGGGFGGCRMEKGARGAHFLKHLAKKLGLSDQQKAQVKAGFEKRRAAMKPLMVSLRGERQQLRTLIHSGTADEAAIRAQSARVAAVEADLAVQKAQGTKELQAILTPEQQVKFKALQSEWAQKMEKRHQHQEGPRHDGSHHEGPEEF